MKEKKAPEKERAISLKRIAEKFFVIFGTLIFCFLFLEVSLRILGHTPSNITEGVFESHGEEYRLKKNIIKVTKWPSFSYITYTNSYGFRDKNIGDRPIKDKPYIVFLGASETYGNGVNYEETFAGVIENLVQRNGYDVFNLAVGGHYLRDQEKLLLDFLKIVSKKPSLALICVGPLTITSFNKINTNVLIKNGYLYKKNSVLIPYLKVTFSNISSTYCFFRDRLREINANVFAQKFKTIDNLLDLYLKNGKMSEPQTKKSFFEYLHKLDDELLEQGIVPLYVYLPIIDSFKIDDLIKVVGKKSSDYDVSIYPHLLEEFCSENQVQFINLEPILKDAFNKGKELRFKFDAHFNAFAHQIIAKHIFESLMGRENRF